MMCAMPDREEEPGARNPAATQESGTGTGDRLIDVVVEMAPAGAVAPGAGALRVTTDAVEVVGGGGAELRIPIDAIDGVRYAGERLTIAVRGRVAVVAVGPPRLAGVAREIVAAACDFPELTRALRGFGSRRSRDAGAHDTLVAPLLAARRRAARAGDVAGQVAAFDEAALRGDLAGVVEGLAAGRAGASTPDRRALAAHLEELAAPVEGALRRLGEAAHRWRREEELGRIARWREWLAAVEQVLLEADRFGFSAGEVLRAWREDLPVPWWRRVLRRDR
jgi:hypothetical protein